MHEVMRKDYPVFPAFATVNSPLPITVEETVGNQLGTTKHEAKIPLNHEPVLVPSMGSGVALGTLGTLLFSILGSHGDPHQIIVTMSSMLPFFGAGGALIGGSLGYAISRNIEINSALKVLTPGFSSSKKLKLSKALPSLKEQQEVIPLKSKFGGPDKEVVVRRKGFAVHFETTTQKPALALWDESMDTLKSVYGLKSSRRFS